MRFLRVSVVCIFALVMLAGCEINRLRSAEEHYTQKRYAAAIQELDSFINTANNGALVTRAEQVRSNSYYQLGEIARQRKNYELAIRFLKLSNSAQADASLAEIYKELAGLAAAKEDFQLQLMFIDSLIREIPGSNLVPEMLYRRIMLHLDVFVDTEYAWQDYMTLFDNYAGTPFELTARKTVDRFVPGKIAYAKTLVSTGYYNEGLQIYFELAKYPVVQTQTINTLIASAYVAQAESFLNAQDYFAADRFFRIAMQYDPGKKAEIDRRLEQIASLFIKKGDALAAAKDFDNALVHYQKTFEIIPDYPAARQAIEKVNITRANIARAKQLFDQGERMEATGKYADALTLYQQANNLDAKPEYSQKAAQMQNLLDAQRNPQEFAQRIINQYRNGLLINRIQNQKKELATRYKANEIRDSGWKFLLSSGQHKYEVRYDLITPRETFLYVWQVNLRDRSITPLNKISEALMR